MNPTPMQSLLAYDGECLRVIEGANYGDTLSFAEDMILDDVYHLTKHAPLKAMSLATRQNAEHFVLTAETELGSPGADLILDCALTFMGIDGKTFEALVFVEVEDNVAEAIFLHPLSPMPDGRDFRLVGIETQNVFRKLAQVACVSFVRGTHITMASGAQTPIEHLKIGDRILTRNDGPQAIRWIGQNTVRAVGDFAPVVLRRRALNNINDLTLSPDHRLFIYQRSDKLGAGRSAVMIKARHLVNNQDIYRQEGGFVDYFQVIFDSHHIIYAEGIAAESMLIDSRTKAALPDDVTRTLPDHASSRHSDYEVQDALLGTDMAARLRAASGA
ncbi:MAG: Hint domain-containing protein [Planktomarina sp.]